jgi:uncharacterized tellurite resistance protein B-like protein
MKKNVKTLIKILIGAAWLDGKIQPEERQYLHRIAQEKNVANDKEIRPLLYELRSVNREECYQWIQDYLGDRPTPEECQSLIEAISGLIYSDGTIADEWMFMALLARLTQNCCQPLEACINDGQRRLIRKIKTLEHIISRVFSSSV